MNSLLQDSLKHQDLANIFACNVASFGVHGLVADGKVQGAVLIGSGYDYRAEIAKISRPAMLRLLNFHFIETSWYDASLPDIVKGQL